MPTNHCDYYLKPILTLAGVKWHITQLAACQQQWNWEWNWVLECTESMASVDNNHQIDDDDENKLGIASDQYNESEGNNPGHDNLWTYAEPNLLYPPSRHALVEDDIEDGSTLTNGGLLCQTDMEKAKYTSCGSQWVPFHNKEWELAHFLMKNVGQTKIDDFLKLALVCVSTLTGLGKKKHSPTSRFAKVDPAWTCKMIDVVGDVVAEDGSMRQEQLGLWCRDPVGCVMELIGNPAF
ncbi:hypothetical protein EDD16DRAFT_1522195 [Pisolithus croceorrhizus]|nr:hypothetical protein EDD16DRAFT_1522195 [Pisolithus croceorrhizus]KAI6111884.1 hypothetical protein EV401DRAFT_1890610 [Pisolithus croceorrhizus]